MSPTIASFLPILIGTIIFLLLAISIVVIVIIHQRRHIESEKKFKIIYNGVFDALIITNPDGRIVDVNESASRLFGYNKDEFLNLRYNDILFDGSSKYLQQILESPLKNNGGYFIEITCKNKEGQKVITEGGVEKIKLNDQPFIVGSFRDITNRKVAERKILDNEMSLRALLNATQDMVVLIDYEGKILAVNEKYSRKFNTPIEELINRSLQDHISPDTADSRLAQIREVIRTGKPHSFNDEQKGEYFEHNLYPVLGDNDNVSKIAIFSRDITEQLKAQEDARLNKEKYRQLVQSVRAGIAVVNYKGEFLFVNQVAATATGKTVEELTGLTQWDVFPQEIADKQMKHIRSIIDTGADHMDESNIYINNEWRWYHTILQPFRDSKGVIIAALVIAHDTTERKRIEEDLKNYQEQLSMFMNSATDSFILFDDELKLLDINEAGLKAFGYSSRNDIRGITIEEVAPNLTAGERYNEYQNVIKTGIPITYDNIFFENRNKENSNISIRAFRVGTGLGLISTDITDGRRNEIRNKARLELLDKLSSEESIDGCLTAGCHAVYNAELYKRSVLTLHDSNRQITNLGYIGLDNETVERGRVAKAPDNELTILLTQDKYKISKSYFIPEESAIDISQTERYILQNKISGDSKVIWQPGDELFVRLGEEDKEIAGWLSVDIPFSGIRPTEEEVMFLEEIVGTVSRKVHEIQYLKQLNNERESLRKINITLEGVLSSIENDRKFIKNQIANKIDRIAMAAFENLENPDGSIDIDQLKILKHSLMNISNENTDFTERYTKLTRREIQVCKYIKEGLSTKEIAGKLNISPSTVESIRKSIRKKLGLNNTKTNLASFLSKYGWA
ncbi:MAG: PAS domain S-box protein [candidate division Zixibacteria bacterium]|nr:PAS domain S-box protein [candidate division Zixibacteria bacterium]